MVLKDGPLKSAIDADAEDNNIIKQELTTYKIIDNMLTREVVTRTYYGNDYYDTTSHEPLIEINPYRIEEKNVERI
tara:strand:+ start:435 stop:662 length:228 start_codon:yes stop_codon:yes gene_type:complete